MAEKKVREEGWMSKYRWVRDKREQEKNREKGRKNSKKKKSEKGG